MTVLISRALPSLDEQSLRNFASSLDLVLEKQSAPEEVRYRLSVSQQGSTKMGVPSLLTRGPRRPLGIDRLPERPLAIHFFREAGVWRAEIRDTGTAIYLGWLRMDLLLLVAVGIGALFRERIHIRPEVLWGFLFIGLVFLFPVGLWFLRRSRDLARLQRILDDYAKLAFRGVR